ncbi:MAG TPA: hypothetical protein VFT22_27575 [Kofleriaceae bacterium]|nr:hypothetical protein [Kofleriaceae bacterium]
MTAQPTSTLAAAQPTSTLAALEARIAEHPWRTLGGAFLLGAWLGLDPPRAPRNAVARTAFAMVGSLALRIARELALGSLAGRTARPMQPPIQH